MREKRTPTTPAPGSPCDQPEEQPTPQNVIVPAGADDESDADVARSSDTSFEDHLHRGPAKGGW